MSTVVIDSNQIDWRYVSFQHDPRLSEDLYYRFMNEINITGAQPHGLIFDAEVDNGTYYVTNNQNALQAIYQIVSEHPDWNFALTFQIYEQVRIYDEQEIHRAVIQQIIARWPMYYKTSHQPKRPNFNTEMLMNMLRSAPKYEADELFSWVLGQNYLLKQKSFNLLNEVGPNSKKKEQTAAAVERALRANRGDPCFLGLDWSQMY